VGQQRKTFLAERFQRRMAPALHEIPGSRSLVSTWTYMRARSVHTLFLHIRHEPDALASATCMWWPADKEFHLLYKLSQSPMRSAKTVTPRIAYILIAPGICYRLILRGNLDCVDQWKVDQHMSRIASSFILPYSHSMSGASRYICDLDEHASIVCSLQRQLAATRSLNGP
jgi:hypothetical protein